MRSKLHVPLKNGISVRVILFEEKKTYFKKGVCEKKHWKYEKNFEEKNKSSSFFANSKCIFEFQRRVASMLDLPLTLKSKNVF